MAQWHAQQLQKRSAREHKTSAQSNAVSPFAAAATSAVVQGGGSETADSSNAGSTTADLVVSSAAAEGNSSQWMQGQLADPALVHSECLVLLSARSGDESYPVVLARALVEMQLEHACTAASRTSSTSSSRRRRNRRRRRHNCQQLSQAAQQQPTAADVLAHLPAAAALGPAWLSAFASRHSSNAISRQQQPRVSPFAAAALSSQQSSSCGSMRSSTGSNAPNSDDVDTFVGRWGSNCSSADNSRGVPSCGSCSRSG